MTEQTKVQHTPGPWRVGGDGFMGTQVDRAKIGSGTPINIVTDGGSGGWSITTFLAYMAAGGDIETRLADAYLIAAAPDLLGCLKQVLKEEEIHFSVGTYHKVMRALALAEPEAEPVKPEARAS